MKKFIVKRFLSLIPILFLVSIGIFSLIHLTPGDPARAILGDLATEDEVMALRESMGLNDPLPVQYFEWLKGVFHGDLGHSIFIDKPMGTILWEHLVPTLNLTLYAMLIAVAIAIPLGVLAARKKGRAADNTVSALTLAGISVPSFLMGIFLILIFAVKLKWLPVAGYKTVREAGFLTHIRYLTLPAIALGLMQAALITRMTKNAMLEVLNSDYMKMALAKGVKQRKRIWKHAFRNALIPIITVIGQSFIALLAGATVVENVFNIPGIGQLVINSAGRRDYEVIQATILVVAVMSVLVNLIVDILYGLANPRIDME
ncbi:MAG: ABC transporter permease [Lachnospiraceae bacterium]